MNNLTIRVRLLILIAVMLGGSLLIGGTGLVGLRTLLGGLNSVYLDRVVPLRDLKQVADLYAVNIVDASHKARSGSLAYTEAATLVEKAEVQIEKIWQAYLQTQLIDDEKRLIGEIEPLMQAARAPLLTLKSGLRSNDEQALISFIDQQLYLRIDPLSEKFSALIEVQLRESEREYQKGLALEKRSEYLMIGTLLLLLVLGGAMAWTLSRGINLRLSELREVVARNAGGDLTRPVSVSGRDEISHVQESF